MATEKTQYYQPTTTSRNADGGGKYDVEMWTYPSDLFNTGANEYGKSWVMININVQKNTANSEAYGEGVVLTESEKRRTTNADARNDTAAAAVAKGALVGAVVGGAKGAWGLFSELLNPATRTGAFASVASSAVKGGVIGAAGAVPLAAAGTAARATKRIRHAIQLPMPNNLASSYSADWGAEDTQIFDAMQRMPGMTFDAVTFSLNGKALDAASSASLQLQGILGGGAGASAAAGLSANPKKEMIFSSMGFRTFTMDYKFFPRDEQEATKIYYILYHLKYHMHPEYLSDGMFTFVYPSEFDITFYNSAGNELTWVNKVATCVLTGLNINYTPDGTWAAHEGGSPVAIQVSMTFRELSILTKDHIEKGF